MKIGLCRPQHLCAFRKCRTAATAIDNPGRDGNMWILFLQSKMIQFACRVGLTDPPPTPRSRCCSISRTWPVFMSVGISLYSAGETSLLERIFDTLGGRSPLSWSSLVLLTLLSSRSSLSPPVLGVWLALLGVAFAVPFPFPFCLVVRVETRLPTTVVVGFTTPCRLRGVALEAILPSTSLFDAPRSGCPVARQELRHFLINNS